MVETVNLRSPYPRNFRTEAAPRLTNLPHSQALVATRPDPARVLAVSKGGINGVWIETEGPYPAGKFSGRDPQCPGRG